MLAGSGWRVTTADVEHSLARTFQQAAGEDGDALAAAYARQFVWDLDLRRDLQRGDRVEVLWRPDPTEVIVVAAARLRSGRLGRTLEAWRWQRPGDSFPSYWDADGVEVPYRLVDGPLDDYEQVTALLKDRPTHKGMDFKTPVGTPVRSPKAATVTRVDWNWRYNGHCIELRYDDGVIAKLLHLSENRVQAGQRVAAGQVIALSGNTGRSTAPHLHYELHRGDRVLDPLEYHEVQRRRLSADELARFRADQARLAATLDRALASL
ncbi:MAG: M23 family metallopeptidase [Deltaproteobacteria bacterium]|nr:MAG: M23 family metallopeptidase [Deltaproteobacteria bacterium]